MGRTEPVRRRIIVFTLAALALVACGPEREPEPPATAAAPEQPAGSPQSDPRAVQIAQAVLERLGGHESWAQTRYVRWRFFGRRLHFWDRHTGDIRIESPARTGPDGVPDPEILVLMNVNTRKGRAWEAGRPVEDPAKLEELLTLGYEWWINDSYWMFMPYKLLDPGVTLEYSGERALEDGRVADVLDLTFDEGVGVTPQNRYEVFVARDSGLVESWSFFPEASETEPRFTMPWENWQRFGKIMLATGHGRGSEWEIAVYEELPGAVFQSPDAVED